MSSPSPKSSGRQKPLSLQARWVGYLVLTFGVLACAAVLMLALQKMKASPADTESLQTLPLSVSAFSVGEGSDIRKEKKIRKGQMRGAWKTRLREAMSTLKFENDSYQIIVQFDYSSLSQRYSKGTYLLEGGLLTFTPDPAQSAPEDALAQERYLRLSASPFSVRVSQSQGRMIWQMPDEENSSEHSFLGYGSGGLAVWDKLP